MDEYETKNTNQLVQMHKVIFTQLKTSLLLFPIKLELIY